MRGEVEEGVRESKRIIKDGRGGIKKNIENYFMIVVD